MAISDGIVEMPCPFCKRPGLAVQRTFNFFFDCVCCGRAGRYNKSSGTTEEEICELPNFQWWTWGNGGKGGKK